jgi:hypothetical protein
MNGAEEMAGRSKRVRGSRVSAVVEQTRIAHLNLAASATRRITRVDSYLCRGQTAFTPFQILLCECADAHPCR